MSEIFRGAKLRIVLVAAAAVTVATALVAGATGSSAAGCGTVLLNEQAWAGSTANTYVAKYVLEKKLGCKVQITKITEIPAFQAMASGKVDVVLEDWQHVDQYKQFVAKQKTVVMGGSNGVNGHIGWYVPDYLMKQYPQFKTWAGLKGKESVFKSPESGNSGMFLGGDPSYTQKDKELIEALGLNLKHVSVGAEPAQVARWTQLVKQKKPVLLYWYTPQYLNVQYSLVEVKLPPRFKGCKDDASAGGPVSSYRCSYSTYPLNKLFSKKFAASGSPAYTMLKKFSWTNDDQNTVATWIAGDHMSPDKAAEKWIKANSGKVTAWLKK
jgi:glycine betaine/proline transport system substrate-binding protein